MSICLDIKDVLEKQRPSPVDGVKAEAYMLIKFVEKVQEIGVALAQLFEHLLNGMLVLSASLQSQPNQILVTLHRRV